MQIKELPGCCAAYVIHDLGYTSVTSGFKGKHNKDRMKQEITNYINHRKNRAFLIIALNAEQRQELGKLVRDEGFRMLSKGFNALHNSDIYLYVRTNKRSL